MIKSTIDGIEVAGIAASVPERTVQNSEWGEIFGSDVVAKIIENTGIVQRHVSGDRLCASDLCFDAAQRLIDALHWDRKEIGVLVFVSQSADYILPATGFPLHERLGLGKSCAVFDVNLGCSGYVYGLWLLSSLLSQSDAKCGLLLTGETNSRLNSPLDRGAALLVGDAGTATALKKNPESRARFVLGSDGSGYRHLMLPGGGMRTPHTPETLRRTLRPDGSMRSEAECGMDGAEVFAFTIREVPKMFKELRALAPESEQAEYYVLHQANRFMLDHLVGRLKIPIEKVPFCLEEYGNTSSASVPLTIASRLDRVVAERACNVVLAGFGVGFSWAAASLRLGPIAVPEIGLVKEN